MAIQQQLYAFTLAIWDLVWNNEGISFFAVPIFLMTLILFLFKFAVGSAKGERLEDMRTEWETNRDAVDRGVNQAAIRMEQIRRRRVRR